MTDISLAGTRVMLAIPCGPTHPWQLTQSVIDSLLAMERRGIAFDFRMVANCSIVTHARTKVAYEFLQSKADTLFMVDSDIAWEADDFLRLLALAQRLPIVCGAYPAKRDSPTFQLRWGSEVLACNEFGCLPIGGIGLGFTAVTRGVIEALADKAPKLRFPWSEEERVPHIFRLGETDDFSAEGEDMAFFADAKALGFQAWLDPSVKLRHVGTKEYAGSIMDAMRKVQ